MKPVNTMNLITDGSDPYYVLDEEDEPSKTCDKKTRKGRCDRKAYQEVYWSDKKSLVSFRHWSYLCRKHYYIDRIKNFIFRWRNWYCDLDD